MRKLLKKLLMLVVCLTMCMGIFSIATEVRAASILLSEQQGTIDTGASKSFSFNVPEDSKVTVAFVGFRYDGYTEAEGTYGGYVLSILDSSNQTVYRTEGYTAFDDVKVSVALKKGNYRLVLKEDDEYTFDYIFSISAVPTTIVSAKSVALNRTSLKLEKGKTYQLQAIISPKNATDAISWKSANKKIATVSSNGKVTAKDFGQTTITATVGKKTAKCTVKISKITTKSIKLNKKNLMLKKGAAYQLKATYSPKNTNDTISWKSANKKVAVVSSKGKVTAKNLGKTTVTAKMGKKTAKCTVVVNSTYVEIIKGKSVSLSAAKYITGYKKAKWKPGNSSVINVTSNYRIAGLKHGKSKVTATIKGSKYTITTYVYDTERLKSAAETKLKSLLKHPSSLVINKMVAEDNFVYIDYSAMNGFGGYNRGTFSAWYDEGRLKYFIY